MNAPRFWPSMLLAVAGFVILYWRVWTKLVADWASNDDYSHGFLIVPLALYFAWERRAALAAAAASPSIGGLGLMLVGLALLVTGTLGAELFLTRVSMLAVIAGSILFAWGPAHLKVLAFPTGFLLLMIPPPAILFNQVAFPLQLVASRFGELALQAFGIPVLREGNVINLAHTTLEVAEACSGIRSLVSLLTVGLVIGYFSDPRPAVRLVVGLAAVPVAIATNALRVAGTGVAAHFRGAEAATGFLHASSGWLMFGLAFLMLVAVQRLLSWGLPQPTDATGHA